MPSSQLIYLAFPLKWPHRNGPRQRGLRVKIDIKAYRIGIMGLGAFVMALAAPLPAAAGDDPAFIAFGAGSFDWNRQKDEGEEFRLEYRSASKHFGTLKPIVAVAATTTDNYFLGVGYGVDLYFGPRVVVTPSFVPHIYSGGNTKLDLDYWLQFRSQIEIAYRFDDRSRLGLAVSHYSNASLGDTNPGTESAMVYYAMPIDGLFGN